MTAWWWWWRRNSCRASPKPSQEDVEEEKWRLGQGGGGNFSAAPQPLSPLYIGVEGLPWPLLQASRSAKERGGERVHPSHYSSFLILEDSLWAGRLGLGGLVCLAHVGQATPSWSYAGLPRVWAPLVTLRNLLEHSDTIREKSELFPKP